MTQNATAAVGIDPELRRVLDEIRAGDSVSFSGVARENGVNLATPFRWHKSGCTGTDGVRRFLAAAKIGRQLRTSRAAVDRFLALLSATPQAASTPRTPAERDRASRAADAELVAMGAK